METFTQVALGQLIGYSLAKDGVTIVDLVEGMSLQEEEWEQIKEANCLPDEVIKKIDKYFEE